MLSNCPTLRISEFIHITILVTALLGYVFRLSVKLQGLQASRSSQFHRNFQIYYYYTRTPQTPLVKRVNIISFRLTSWTCHCVHKTLLWQNHALPTLVTLPGEKFENTAGLEYGYMSQNLKTVCSGENWVNSANLVLSLGSWNSKKKFHPTSFGWKIR